MLTPEDGPRLVFKRMTCGARRRRRYGRNCAEFGSAGGPIWDLPCTGSVIALIDPKPFTRESLIRTLVTSLAGRVSLLGVSSFGELRDPLIAKTLINNEENLCLIILYTRSASVGDTWVQQQLQMIQALRPEIPVIMVSDRDDLYNVKNAIDCGIRGYIPTSISLDVAVAALNLIETGGTYIPANVLHAGVEEIQGEGKERSNEVTEGLAGLNLTSRELAVVDLLREGCANKVIAIKLNMRESTVKVHVRNIFKKLRATNRTHAATVANRLLAKPDYTGELPKGRTSL